MKEKRISDQFNNRIVELAKKTDEEIGKIVDDHLNVMETLGKHPNLWEYLETYDNTLIAVIQDLFGLREMKRRMLLKSRATEGKKTE